MGRSTKSQYRKRKPNKQTKPDRIKKTEISKNQTDTEYH